MMAGEHKLHLVQLRVHRGQDVEYEILAPPRIRGGAIGTVIIDVSREGDLQVPSAIVSVRPAYLPL